MHPQLTLSLGMTPATTFGTYHIDEGNRLCVQALSALANGSIDDEQIYLWGEAGAGKSHLLSAACQESSARGYRIAYIPGELANSTAALDGLEYCSLVCIDDLQRLDRAAEVDLFHCINRCRETDTKLLFAADRTPDELGLTLKDLETRLSWGLKFQLPILGDEALMGAFRDELEARSLAAGEEVVAYVMKRFPRRIDSLKHVVDQLDAASLTEQRRITIPFVKQVLENSSAFLA